MDILKLLFPKKLDVAMSLALGLQPPPVMAVVRVGDRIRLVKI